MLKFLKFKTRNNFLKARLAESLQSQTGQLQTRIQLVRIKDYLLPQI